MSEDSEDDEDDDLPDPLARIWTVADLAAVPPDPLASISVLAPEPAGVSAVSRDPLATIVTVPPTALAPLAFDSVDPLEQMHVPRPRGRKPTGEAVQKVAKQEEQVCRATKSVMTEVQALQHVDDRIACVLAFAARLDNVSNRAVSDLLRSLLPSLMKLVPDISRLTLDVDACLERRSIDRSRVFAACAIVFLQKDRIGAIRMMDMKHPYMQGFDLSLDEDLLAVVDWMWDETHQCLQDSPGHELLAHLPLRREYVQALRSGGILAARSVAMSVMVQLGGLLLHSLTRGCDIIDERVLVPLLRLRRLTAATLLTAIEAWMPCTPLNPGKLAESAEIVF